MRFLVTGANGLVGIRLAAVLQSRGHEVLGLSRGPRRGEGGFAYYAADLTVAGEVDSAVSQFKPDVIVHPASMTEVDRCEKEPDQAWATNVRATGNIARAAKASGAHLVHVSTDYVFDGNHGPYSEDDVPNPRGIYATTKMAAEYSVRVLAPGAAIARTAVVYGYPPSSARSNFGVWLVNALEQGQPAKLFEDQYISPSYAENVAEMLAELGERRLGGVWHTCGAEVVSRIEFGRALCGVFGFDEKLLVPVKLADLNLAAPRPLRSGLKTDKTAAQLKAKPLPLRRALELFRDAYRAGKDHA